MVPYNEIRAWAHWLSVFTAQEIAEAMGTSLEEGEKACIALSFKEVVEEAGEIIEDGELVPVYEVLPLPEGPTEHETKTPPEILAARPQILYNTRGVQVRIEDTKRRNLMSVPGARAKMKRRDQNRRRMEQAQRERAEKNREKEQRRKTKVK